MAINTAVGNTYVVGTVRYNSVYSGILQITINSVNVATNTSTVTIKWVYKKNQADPWDGWNHSGTSNVTLRVNGENYPTNPAHFDLRNAAIGTTLILATKTLSLTHDADGSKAILVGGTHVTGISWGTLSAPNQTIQLPNIARASSIASVTSNVEMNGTNAVTVTISSAATTFTHRVVFALGDYSKAYLGVAKTQAFAIPLAWCAKLPNSTAGSATVTVITYNGNVQIGTPVSKSFRVTVPATLTPSFTALTATGVNGPVPAAWGLYVQGQSKVRLAITGAAGVQGSTVVGYHIVGDTYAGNGSTLTTGQIAGSGTLVYTATITDSRGRKASKTVSITAVAYAAPQLLDTTALDRCDAGGVLREDGDYLRILPHGTVAACGGKNTATLQARYQAVGKEWSTPVPLTLGIQKIVFLGAGSADRSYRVALSLTDALQTQSVTYDISTSKSVIDLKAGGTGIAFGKASEKAEVAEFAWSILATGGFYHVPLPSGTDLDTITTTGFYHCRSTVTARTLLHCPTAIAFGMQVTEHAGICQEVTEYTTTGARKFFRNFYGDIWGAWVVMAQGEMLSGTINAKPTAINTTESMVVPYGRTFLSVPHVVVTPRIGDANLAKVSVGVLTTTGFTLYFEKSTLATFAVEWIAVAG